MRLNFEIKVIWEQSNRTYGSPRIIVQLRRNGWVIVKNRVVKRMKFMEIASIRHKKYKRNFKSGNKANILPNTLNRNFNISEPNKVWISDITHIQINGKLYYLATIMDLFSRKIIGWDLSKSFDKELVINAFNKAKLKRKITKRLLFHSDQGVQYSSNEFKERL